MKGITAHNPGHALSGLSVSASASNKSYLAYDAVNSNGHGVLSPLSSACASTTVTPVTPMTPLTTPVRTPLQILLGGSRGRSAGYPHLARARDDHDEQLLTLQLLANFINTAESTLNDITERESSGQEVLGPGIVRLCRDLADDIELMAKQLHKGHLQASHVFGQMKDIEVGNNRDAEEKSSKEIIDDTYNKVLAMSKSESISSLQSHEEFMTTLSTTHSLLIDMAAALRAITHREAQELGEVALEVARMFVYSLNMVHKNLIQMTLANDHAPKEPCGNDDADPIPNSACAVPIKARGGKQHRVTFSSSMSSKSLGPVVEILGEEEKKEEASTPTNTVFTSSKLSPIPASPDHTQRSISPMKSPGRVRVLWPPVLPMLSEAGKYCMNGATQNPIPATAVSLTFGPVAIITAGIAGPPILVADWAVQTSYNALAEHTPIIGHVERGAANALQVAKLGIICSKLVVKQGIQVCERQVERRGGVGRICADVVDGAIDMASHPIETSCKAFDGLLWGVGALSNVVGFVADSVGGSELVE